MYFEDAEAEPKPAALSADHWVAVKTDLHNWVKAL